MERSSGRSPRHFSEGRAGCERGAGMFRACRIVLLLVWAGGASIPAAADSASYTFRGFRLGMPLAEAQQPFAALKCESRHTLDDGKTLICMGERDPATLAATEGLSLTNDGQAITEIALTKPSGGGGGVGGAGEEGRSGPGAPY